MYTYIYTYIHVHIYIYISDIYIHVHIYIYIYIVLNKLPFEHKLTLCDGAAPGEDAASGQQRHTLM